MIELLALLLGALARTFFEISWRLDEVGGSPRTLMSQSRDVRSATSPKTVTSDSSLHIGSSIAVIIFLDAIAALALGAILAGSAGSRDSLPGGALRVVVFFAAGCLAPDRLDSVRRYILLVPLASNLLPTKPSPIYRWRHRRISFLVSEIRVFVDRYDANDMARYRAIAESLREGLIDPEVFVDHVRSKLQGEDLPTELSNLLQVDVVQLSDKAACSHAVQIVFDVLNAERRDALMVYTSPAPVVTS